jgi:hypothetical protein
MEEIDVALSQQLDRPGKMSPLLTLGEARAARYALHLFGQGDGPGSQAARDLEIRLERRLEAMFPGEDICFAEESSWAL